MAGNDQDIYAPDIPEDLTIYGDEPESFDDAVQNVIDVAQAILPILYRHASGFDTVQDNDQARDEAARLADELKRAIEDLEAWLGEPAGDDPRANGWVDDSGRP